MSRRADFLAANRGRRAPMPGFVLLVRERGDGDPAMRIGITVTKKIGGAVIRNRMKRRFRVLARELLPTHGIAGADHVLIGREGGIERDFALLHAELGKALGKIMTRPIDPPRGPSRGKSGSVAKRPAARKSDALPRKRESSPDGATIGDGGTGFPPAREHEAPES
ncbi:ribonuclease P protein component [Sphingobium sp. CR2-8]|nr:ribonuclease P protein component [Sphingobium sp. CR2-8]MEC3909984.1 ribonuclease P protein component [Sphingobium sp. CR2-8]